MLTKDQRTLGPVLLPSVKGSAASPETGEGRRQQGEGGTEGELGASDRSGYFTNTAAHIPVCLAASFLEPPRPNE